MDVEYLKKKIETAKKQRRQLYSFLQIVGAGVMLLVMVLIIANIVFIGNKSDSPFGLNRLKNTFSFVFLGNKPNFYYLIMEKNGSDYKFTGKDVFDVTYRDEFIIKDVSSDVLGGRGISVDIEATDNPDDFMTLNRGIDLVDKVIAKVETKVDTVSVEAGNINVKYNGEIIASIPMNVTITPQDWLRYARNSENLKTQIDYLKRAIAMNKEDISTRKMLAAVYTRTGVTRKAIEQYEKILALKPGDIGASVELMKCYIEEKENDKAIKIGKELIRIKNRDASVFANIARAYGSKGDWARAIAYYKDSLKINPDDLLTRFKLGEAYEKNKDMKSAIEHYKHVLAKVRDDERVKIALAGAYLNAGNYDEAIRWYREIIQKQPRNANAYANLGIAYGGKGLWKEEVENYRKAISLNGKDPILHFNLAVALEKGNRDKEAILEYKKVLKINPNDIEAVQRLADIEFKNKRYDQAANMYERVVKYSPKRATVYANLGYAYGELKKYKHSSACYVKAIRYGIKDPQIHFNLAYTYEKMGKKRDAIREYEIYASSRPTMEVLDILAEYYMQEKKYDSAMKTYRKMIDIDPRRAAAYSSLAYIYGLKNETDKEIEYYKMSLRYETEDYYVFLKLGAAYEKKRLYQDAYRVYTKAYELNPDSVEAAQKIPEMKIKTIQQKHQK